MGGAGGGGEEGGDGWRRATGGGGGGETPSGGFSFTIRINLSGFVRLFVLLINFFGMRCHQRLQATSAATSITHTQFVGDPGALWVM